MSLYQIHRFIIKPKLQNPAPFEIPKHTLPYHSDFSLSSATLIDASLTLSLSLLSLFLPPYLHYIYVYVRACDFISGIPENFPRAAADARPTFLSLLSLSLSLSLSSTHTLTHT